MTGHEVTLWRAGVPPVWTGYGSWWAPHRIHAERHARLLGHPGRVVVSTRALVTDALDMRGPRVREAFARVGLDLDDYPITPAVGVSPIVMDTVRVFSAAGYRWLVLNEGDDETFDELVYLGEGSLAAGG